MTLYLVCHEDCGCICEPALFDEKANAVAEIRKRRERDLKEYHTNDPTDGFWVEEDSCYAHPSGFGWVSLTAIPEESIHYTDWTYTWYAVNLDEGGSVSNVELYDNAHDAYHAMLGLVQSWNETEDSEYLMEQVDEDGYHYDDNNGFGYIFYEEPLEVE